ncbi:hypothetical protein EJA72_22955 [Pseudomonas sp. PB120]|uniref:hypothetical protein n=1 Tax=Pseudomonas sp. PB120 TaxID=2494700 RepID=UPI0012FE19C0|nr:hypothetical protein [Pseudomonas sp. PB120]MVV51076.1 hypothetical protein [Pseudomonas sp. PB120]
MSEAKDFDVNSLSPAELELNYNAKSAINLHSNAQEKKLEFPIRVTHKTDPKEKLANLVLARVNIAKRLASDPPGDTRARRQLMLDLVNMDIAKLADQIKQVRSSHPTI